MVHRADDGARDGRIADPMHDGQQALVVLVCGVHTKGPTRTEPPAGTAAVMGTVPMD